MQKQKTKDTKEPVKLGRPPVSKYVYKPEYCDKLIELGKTGGTIAMFCSDLGIYKEIFYQWAEKYPEFSDAKKIHEVNWEAHSDKLGVLAQAGELKGFALGVWIWNRKNKLKERDRFEVEQTTKYEPIVIEVDEKQIKLEMVETKTANASHKITQIPGQSV